MGSRDCPSHVGAMWRWEVQTSASLVPLSEEVAPEAVVGVAASNN